MPLLRALVTIPMDSALPEDSVTNSLYFDSPGVDFPTNMTDLTTALTAFYQAVDGYMSVRCNNPATIRYYNMDDPTPRTPLREDTMTLTYGTATMPQELAVCLTFQGAKVSGQPQARRRGRIYIGPLSTTGVTDDRPAGVLISALGTAATNLASAAFAAGVPWHVRSEVSGTSVPVTDGWIDNAIDVQRRRGVRATARTLWT